MDKNRNYDKHQKSRYKKFVATTTNGKRLQSDSERELHEKLAEVSGKPVQSFEVSIKPKFDPDTGERIN